MFGLEMFHIVPVGTEVSNRAGATEVRLDMIALQSVPFVDLACALCTA
jgi:hypothetical protein